jgi:DnaJ-class molecular chaperone
MPRILSRLLIGLLVGGLAVVPPLALTLRAQQAVSYSMCGACYGLGKVKHWQVDPCPRCGGDGKETRTCDRCGGRGTIARTCGRCGGDGRIWVTSWVGPGRRYIERREMICPRCNGTGIAYRRCSKCGGDGTIEVLCSLCRGRGEYGYWTWKVCPHCHGTGRYVYEPHARNPSH